MKRIFLAFLFFFLVKTGFCQVERIPYYSGIEFNNEFAVIAENDAKSNYYAVNLDIFSSPFEKSYFCELCFKESKIVRLDSGNKKIAWFKSEKNFNSNDIQLILNNLKITTINKANSMTASQKQDWLNNSEK